MRRPRISIAGVMIAVLLIAADIAVMRTMLSAAETGKTPNPLVYLLALGVPPMASLLVYALILALWGWWRRGESYPFVVGFEVFGMTALIVYVVLVAWFAERHPDDRGYSVRPPGYSDIHTVYVPVFHTMTLRRDVQLMLTEAVIKEIEERTRYKVVGSPEAANSVLEGTIDFADKNLVVENPQNLPRELNAWVQATVRWNRNPALGQERNAPPVVVGETVNFIPEIGEVAKTAYYKTCQNLATQIVDMMDSPW